MSYLILCKKKLMKKTILGPSKTTIYNSRYTWSVQRCGKEYIGIWKRWHSPSFLWDQRGAGRRATHKDDDVYGTFPERGCKK
jgi:hypothetical protein